MMKACGFAAITLLLATGLGAAMAQDPPGNGPGPCPTGIMGPLAGALTYSSAGCDSDYDASATNYVEITTNATGSEGCFSQQSQIWREAGAGGCGLDDTVLADTGVKPGTIECALDQTVPYTQTITTAGTVWACGTTCNCFYYNPSPRPRPGPPSAGSSPCPSPGNSPGIAAIRTPISSWCRISRPPAASCHWWGLSRSGSP
jgi:hypothetical protein